jgi:hypothetical protein
MKPRLNETPGKFTHTAIKCANMYDNREIDVTVIAVIQQIDMDYARELRIQGCYVLA